MYYGRPGACHTKERMKKLGLTKKRRIVCDGYLFPEEYYDIPGVEFYDDLAAVRRYVRSRLDVEEPVDKTIGIYINGGLAVELLSVLQVCSERKLSVSLFHWNQQTGQYVMQEVRWKADGSFGRTGPTGTYALCDGRHPNTAVHAVYPQIPNERMFDFTWLEEQAGRFLDLEQIKSADIFLSGLTTAYISVLNAAYDRKIHVRYLHYNYDTESYFYQDMDQCQDMDRYQDMDHFQEEGCK